MNSIIDQLYPLVSDNYNKILLFSIGSYPHRPESNHENPLIYQSIRNNNGKHFEKFKIYRILIDPQYTAEDMLYHNILQKFDSHTLIYNINITHREYYTLIDFANYISRHNCLSIIMEFTSINRHNIANLNDYVYITPSDCLGDTDKILYYPTIKYNKKLNKYVFYNLNDRLILFDEYLDTCKKQEFDFNRLLYIRELIKKNFKSIDNLYRKMLNYMKVKEEIETNFNKTSEFYFMSKQLLLKRMCGYTYHQTEEVLVDFEKSKYQDLNRYLNDIILNILYDCCYIEKLDNCQNEKLCNTCINFTNDTELYEHIKYFRSYFENQEL